MGTRALPYGGDVFANNGFKIRGWDETGLHVGSARHFGGSIGTLVTADADMARKPAVSEWWFNAMSATEAIFTARTC